MNHHLQRRAFTLLEVLAAIILIGMIVAVVTPLLLRTGSAALRYEQSIDADAVLEAELAEVPLPMGDGTRPVRQRPEWTLSWVALVPAVNHANEPTFIAHRWLWVQVKGPGAATAERVIPLVIRPGPG